MNKTFFLCYSNMKYLLVLKTYEKNYNFFKNQESVIFLLKNIEIQIYLFWVNIKKIKSKFKRSVKTCTQHICRVVKTIKANKQSII